MQQAPFTNIDDRDPASYREAVRHLLPDRLLAPSIESVLEGVVPN